MKVIQTTSYESSSGRTYATREGALMDELSEAIRRALSIFRAADEDDIVAQIIDNRKKLSEAFKEYEDALNGIDPN